VPTSGSLSGINIYNTALSAAQVAGLYTTVAGNSPLPSATNVTIGPGATLDVNGVSQTVGSVSGPAGAAIALGSGGGVLTTGAAVSSTFVGSISGTGTVNKQGASTFSLNGSLAAGVTVNVNGGAVSFGGNSGNVALNRTFAALNIGSGASSIVAASTYPFTPLVLQPTVLSFAADGTSKLNLTNNEVFDSEPLQAAVDRITTGQIFTTSTGGGLGSLALSANQTEIRFTLLGDTNLDGSVDVGDLGSLATNYGATSGATWAGGDSNYDGAVGVGDLGALATNYGQSLLSGGTVAAIPTATIAAGAVPEPTSAMILAVLLTAGLRRRRSKA
jgi:hypothetical protein